MKDFSGCVHVFVYNKEPSRLHMRTLADWEGRICFGFDLAVRGFSVQSLFGLWICETERLEAR